MAVYKKKGYKKEKKKVDGLDFVPKDSTTAEVFTSLDEGANKIEKFIEKNQKWIFSALAIIILAVVGYMWYDSNVAQPMEQEAIDNMSKAQFYFDKALNETEEDNKKADFDKAFNGADGKFGFKHIAEKYSGTKAGNLANYYIGVIDYNNANYKEAVASLSNFKTDDEVLQSNAYGLVGDAFVQLEQLDDALKYYEKAINFSDNSFTTPMYLFKAGNVALKSGDKAKAKKYFQRIKDDYEKSTEAKNIDEYIAMAE